MLSFDTKYHKDHRLSRTSQICTLCLMELSPKFFMFSFVCSLFLWLFMLPEEVVRLWISFTSFVVYVRFDFRYEHFSYHAFVRGRWPTNKTPHVKLALYFRWNNFQSCSCVGLGLNVSCWRIIYHRIQANCQRRKKTRDF